MANASIAKIKILAALWKFRRHYFEVFIATIVINLFALATPLFVMNVYDRVVSNNALVTLWVLAVGVLIVYIFDVVLRLLRSYIIDVCAKNIDTNITHELFANMLGMQLEKKPGSIGAFINNFREFEAIRDFITSIALTLVIDLPFLVLYLIVIAMIGGVVVTVPLIIIPVVLLSVYLIEKPLNKSVRSALQIASQKNSILVESLTSLEAVKELGIEKNLQHKYDEYVKTAAVYSLKSRLFSNMSVNCSYIAQLLVTLGMVVVGVYLIADSQLSLGGLIACTTLASKSLAPLAQAANLLTRYSQAKIALQSVDEILTLPQEKLANKQFLHVSLQGNIEFTNVNFRYPGQTTNALDNVSLKIAAGEHVAIVGRVGSGKSTLNKLLDGLYRPQAGCVHIDGIDVFEIDPTDLRKQIGFVAQDARLFAGNVRDNIAIANPAISDEEIIKIAELVGISEFLKHGQTGYNLAIGERGETLSGGQRQAIALARALITNPSILLLDEFTSAMDDQTEKELIKNLKPFLKNKTVLLVTHRMSLLELVDRIIVLDSGKVVADNLKQDILKKGA